MHQKIWTSRRIVVTQQPQAEFYKDEGGKSNFLSVKVTLAEFNIRGQSVRTPNESFVPIPLKVNLYYESGKPVDDADQDMFRFVGNDYDSIVIDPSSREAVIHFRLEKVSRRKDGQRFKLKIEPRPDQCVANISDLEPVYTNAICVLSKRKYQGTSSSCDSNTRESSVAQKRGKEGVLHLEKRLCTRLDELDKKMDLLQSQCMAIHEFLLLQRTTSNCIGESFLLPMDETGCDVELLTRGDFTFSFDKPS